MVRYQRAFIDFFEDQLVSKKYDIEDLVDEFMFRGKEPLVNGLISGRMFGIPPYMSIANMTQSPILSSISVTPTNFSPRLSRSKP